MTVFFHFSGQRNKKSRSNAPAFFSGMFVLLA